MKNPYFNMFHYYDPFGNLKANMFSFGFRDSEGTSWFIGDPIETIKTCEAIHFELEGKDSDISFRIFWSRS